MTAFPIPELIQLKFPDDGDTARVQAELRAMIDRVLQDAPAKDAPPAAPDDRFHLLYIPPDLTNPYRYPEQLIRIPFSLEHEQLKTEMERAMRSIFILHGAKGMLQVATSLEFTQGRYLAESNYSRSPALLPNAAQFKTLDKLYEASNKVGVAELLARRSLKEKAEAAVAIIEICAVQLGKERLEAVRPQIAEETSRYFDFIGTPEEFLSTAPKHSHAILRGPDIRDLVAAINEIGHDRFALEKATHQVQASRVCNLQLLEEFEQAARKLDNTVNVLCDEYPVLYRIGKKAAIFTSDVGFDNAGGLVGRSPRGIQSVINFQSLLFQTLKESFEANVSLSSSLNASKVWDYPPLIDLALEKLGEAGPTVYYRAAQERLQAQESTSVTGILSMVTGALEMGGTFMAAEPPIMLALAVASAGLSIWDRAQEFFELRDKDQAYLASLDPQLSLSTEPSYFGFYVNVAFSMLDIKGVRDAARTWRIARSGNEIDDAVKAFSEAP